MYCRYGSVISKINTQLLDRRTKLANMLGLAIIQIDEDYFKDDPDAPPNSVKFSWQPFDEGAAASVHVQLVSLAKADESTADCLLRLVDAKAATKINFDEKGESFVLTASDRWRTLCVEWGEVNFLCQTAAPPRRDGLAGGQFHKVSKKKPILCCFAV